MAQGRRSGAVLDLNAAAAKYDQENAQAKARAAAVKEAQVKNLQLEQQLRLDVARKSLERSVPVGDAKVREQSVRDAFDLGAAVAREHFARSIRELANLERELDPESKPDPLLETAAKRNGVDLAPPPTLVSG